MKKLIVYLWVFTGLSCGRKDKIAPEAEEPAYVYINTERYTFALDPDTGKTVWQFGRFGSSEPSSPTLVGKVVYVTGEEAVYGLDALTGNLIWQSPPIRYGSTSPVVNDGVVYVGTIDRILYAFDIKSGEKKWEFESSYIVCSPTVVNNEIYFTDTYSTLRCLDKNTGQLKWKTEGTSGTVRSNPVYYNNSILTGLNYTFVSLDAKTGELNWRFQSGGEVVSSPVIYNDRVFFGSTYGYSVFCLDVNTKKKIWSLKSDQAFSSPYIQNDTLLMGFINGMFYSVNANDGNVHWAVDVKEMISYASPVAAGNKIYLPTEGSLLCLNASDGSEHWRIRPGAGLSSPTVLLKNGKAKHPAPNGQAD